MKKLISYLILATAFLISCQKQKVWEYQVLPNTCIADAYCVIPDFKPRSFVLEMKGTLNQDVTVFLSGTQPSTDIPNGRFVGLENTWKLKRGTLNFSTSSEIYVEDLKIIIVGSGKFLPPDTVAKKNSPSRQCLLLGDIKMKITLK